MKKDGTIKVTLKLQKYVLNAKYTRISSLDLRNTYSQLRLCKDTSEQGNLSVVGGETTKIINFNEILLIRRHTK